MLVSCWFGCVPSVGGGDEGGLGATNRISESLFNPFNFRTVMFPFSSVSRILKCRFTSKLFFSLIDVLSLAESILPVSNEDVCWSFFSRSCVSFFKLTFLRTVPIADLLLIVLPKMEEPILETIEKIMSATKLRIGTRFYPRGGQIFLSGIEF